MFMCFLKIIITLSNLFLNFTKFNQRYALNKFKRKKTKLPKKQSIELKINYFPKSLTHYNFA